MWRHYLYRVGWCADPLVHFAHDFCGNPLRVGRVSHFRRDNEPLSPPSRICYTEGNNAPSPHPWYSSSYFFNFLWKEVSSGLDDDVLRSSGDIDLAIRPVRAVA